jgi:hypothetical protein
MVFDELACVPMAAITRLAAMRLGGAFDGDFNFVGAYQLAEIVILPAERQRSRSSFIALAVMATI